MITVCGVDGRAHKAPPVGDVQAQLQTEQMPSFHLTSNPLDRLNLIYSSYAMASWDRAAEEFLTLVLKV